MNMTAEKIRTAGVDAIALPLRYGPETAPERDVR